MSGTGADGSLGLKAVKAKGGLVLAQEVGEADYDGMPRSAIATGDVDHILSGGENRGGARRTRARRRRSLTAPTPRHESVHDWLPDIVDLLRKKTAHDFTLYKRGTLERHVERRMAMAAIKTAESYLARLRRDEAELEQLSREMLINVTGFFRDPPVFDYLATRGLPGLVRDHPLDRPLRIWIAGCSSGEETYSLAILFREADRRVRSARSNCRFSPATSIADAVASAREGLYPHVDRGRCLAGAPGRFFTREDRGYRISPDLRASVVFSVHDVLADPPFAKLDFVSCRNLLIYLLPEAQARVISLFHFALREGGLLLLGNSETVGLSADGASRSFPSRRASIAAWAATVPAEFGSTADAGDGPRVRPRPGPAPPLSRQAAFSELCRSMVLDAYGPAAVLINRKLECLFSQGPTDRYLKVAAGRPSRDVIAMAREGVQTKLRSAIQGALRTQARFASSVGRIEGEAGPVSFTVVAEPAPNVREELLLVCFVEAPALQRRLPDRVRRSTLLASPNSNGSSRRRRPSCDRRPQYGDHERRADGDQRRGAVGQRGISVHERRVDVFQGGIAIAQRGTERSQQPIAGDAGAATNDRRRFAERALQHRRRDDLPRHAASTSGSSRRRRKRCSTSFRATWGGLSRT